MRAGGRSRLHRRGRCDRRRLNGPRRFHGLTHAALRLTAVRSLPARPPRLSQRRVGTSRPELRPRHRWIRHRRERARHSRALTNRRASAHERLDGERPTEGERHQRRIGHSTGRVFPAHGVDARALALACPHPYGLPDLMRLRHTDLDRRPPAGTCAAAHVPPNAPPPRRGRRTLLPPRGRRPLVHGHHPAAHPVPRAAARPADRAGLGAVRLHAGRNPRRRRTPPRRERARATRVITALGRSGYEAARRPRMSSQARYGYSR